MLTYLEGDMFNSPALVLVNTVNTVGVMGKGVALSFKRRYPEMFEEYRAQCERHKLMIGKLMLWYAPDHWVLNFPTKEHWRNPSRLEYIEKGLMSFCRKYADYNITSIAFPRLGCGNGELDWNDVRPLMERYLRELPIDIYVYLGLGDQSVPEHKDQQSMSTWLKAHARDMSYAGVLDDIIYNSTIVPVEFGHEGAQWSARWDGAASALLLSNAATSMSIDDESFYQLWASIRNRGIFTLSDDATENVVYSLLESRGYLERVRVQDDSNQLVPGYQLDAGQDRYYAVRNEDDL